MRVDSGSPNEPWPWAHDERLRKLAEEHRRRLPELDRRFAQAMRNAGADLPPRLQRVLDSTQA